MAVFELCGLSKSFSDRRKQPIAAVQDVSFKISEGEWVSLVGPSGAGKTSLLRLLAGLETPDQGQFLAYDQEITHEPPEKRPITMMFQGDGLYPHYNVHENISLGLKLRKVPADSRRTQVASVMEELKLSEIGDRMPDTLSGGQKRRVALARILVLDAKLYLFDEPLSHLDPVSSEELADEIKQCLERRKAAAILVTHDQTEAFRFGHRVGVFLQGRLTQMDTPEEIYFRPINRDTASFIGQPPINLISMKLTRRNESTLNLESPTNGAGEFEISLRGVSGTELDSYVDSEVLVGIRPESITHDHQDGIKSEVVKTEFTGPTQIATLQIGNTRLRASLPTIPVVKSGTRFSISKTPENLILFDPVSNERIWPSNRS